MSCEDLDDLVKAPVKLLKGLSDIECPTTQFVDTSVYRVMPPPVYHPNLSDLYDEIYGQCLE